MADYPDGRRLSDEELLATLQDLYARPLAPAPGPLRDVALLCIDLQYRTVHPDYGHGPRAQEDSDVGEILRGYYERLQQLVLPNVRTLQTAFRRRGLEVIHFRVAPHSRDGRDNSRRYAGMGIRSGAGTRDIEIVPEVGPEGDEIVLSKTTSSAFGSTDLDRILRRLGVSTIVACGVVTNGCVETTVRAAADLDYAAVVVEDASSAIEPRIHERALSGMSLSYATVLSTQEVVSRLQPTAETGARAARSARGVLAG